MNAKEYNRNLGDKKLLLSWLWWYLHVCTHLPKYTKPCLFFPQLTFYPLVSFPNVQIIRYVFNFNDYLFISCLIFTHVLLLKAFKKHLNISQYFKYSCNLRCKFSHLMYNSLLYIVCNVEFSIKVFCVFCELQKYPCWICCLLLKHHTASTRIGPF